MKRRHLMLVLVSAVLAGAVFPSTAIAISRSTQRRELLTLTQKAMNNELRFLHGSWFQQNSRYSTVPVSSIVEATGTADSTATLEVLDPPNGYSVTSVDQPGATSFWLTSALSASPGTTRRQASAAYATALALANGTFDPGRVGISRQEASRRTVAWINGLAISHARDPWGEGWQSSLWTYYLGAGAKQIWSSLPTCTQDLVTQAVSEEADELTKIPPPFYRNAAGTTLFPGDSKSEENAWNAALLMLAARQFATSSHAAAWEAQYRNYALTAYATPNQIGRDPRITGYNLNSDGTVTNHGQINPDYMASCGEMLVKYQLVAHETASSVPWEGTNNFWRVWRGLTRLSFNWRRFRRPGGTIFRYSHGAPTSNVFYPQGADWSSTRRFNFAQTSAEVWAQGFENSRAYGFCRADLLFTLRQQGRHSDGHIFNGGETRFTDDEQLAAASLAEMVSRLQIAH